MSKYHRRKGGDGEREIVNLFKAYDIPAKRISMMETGGIDKGDVAVAEVYTAQVKVGGKVPRWIYDAAPNGEDMLITRRDRRKWRVTMDLDYFIERFMGGIKNGVRTKTR